MADHTRLHSTVVPGMWYRDAVKAIDWLCRVFGFERHLVVPGPENTVIHAELTLGGGMIMLGSIRENERRRFLTQPDEIGGAETVTVNLFLDDADVVYARAKAAGAEILFEIQDKPFGGRGFTCRDLEGHIWNVDTYDPWRRT